MLYLWLVVHSIFLLCKADDNGVPSCRELGGECVTKYGCGQSKDLIKIESICENGEICCIRDRQVCEAIHGKCSSEKDVTNCEGDYFFKDDNFCTDPNNPRCCLSTAAPECEAPAIGGQCEIKSGDGACRDIYSEERFKGSCFGPSLNGVPEYQCCLKKDSPLTCKDLGGRCLRRYKKKRCNRLTKIPLKGICKDENEICCYKESSSQCEKLNGQCRQKSMDCKPSQERLPTPNICTRKGEICCLPKKSKCELLGGKCLGPDKSEGNCQLKIQGDFCFQLNESCCLQNKGCSDVGGKCIDKTIQSCDSVHQFDYGRSDCVGDEECCLDQDIMKD